VAALTPVRVVPERCALELSARLNHDDSGDDGPPAADCRNLAPQCHPCSGPTVTAFAVAVVVTVTDSLLLDRARCRCHAAQSLAVSSIRVSRLGRFLILNRVGGDGGGSVAAVLRPADCLLHSRLFVPHHARSPLVGWFMLFCPEQSATPESSGGARRATRVPSLHVAFNDQH
jgi:hypothetical protein